MATYTPKIGTAQNIATGTAQFSDLLYDIKNIYNTLYNSGGDFPTNFNDININGATHTGDYEVFSVRSQVPDGQGFSATFDRPDNTYQNYLGFSNNGAGEGFIGTPSSLDDTLWIQGGPTTNTGIAAMATGIYIGPYISIGDYAITECLYVKGNVTIASGELNIQDPVTVPAVSAGGMASIPSNCEYFVKIKIGGDDVYFPGFLL